jgi:hypothetical protein
MQNEERIRRELRAMVTTVEQYYLSDEGKLSFADVLRLIQHRDLEEECNRPDVVQAWWTEPELDPVDLAA